MKIPLQGHQHKRFTISTTSLPSQCAHHGNTNFVSVLNRINTGLKTESVGRRVIISWLVCDAIPHFPSLKPPGYRQGLKRNPSHLVLSLNEAIAHFTALL